MGPIKAKYLLALVVLCNLKIPLLFLGIKYHPSYNTTTLFLISFEFFPWNAKNIAMGVISSYSADHKILTTYVNVVLYNAFYKGLGSLKNKSMQSTVSSFMINWFEEKYKSVGLIPNFMCYYYR